MKRILLILLVSLGAVFAKAQTPFTTPNLLTGGNTKITQNKGAGQFDSGFILVQIFADTIAANGSAISLKAGAMIRVGDAIYIRNTIATQWINVSDGSVTYIGVVNTITELEAYSALATTIIVTDSLRGGVFNYYTSGLTIDNGLVFPATGKGSGYWKRQTTPSQGVNITWFGARPDSSATFNGLVINSLSAAGYKELYVPTYIPYDPEQIGDANSDDLKLVDDYNQSIVFGRGAVLSTPISNPTHLSLQPLRKDKVTGLWISGKDPYPQAPDGTGTYNTLKIGWEDLEAQLLAGTYHYGDFGLTLQKDGFNGFGAARFNTKENGEVS